MLLVPVLVLAGFGFCVMWAHVLFTLVCPFQDVWDRLLAATLRWLPPLLGEPPLSIHDDERLPLHGMLAYEHEMAKACLWIDERDRAQVTRRVAHHPPQSVSGIIPYGEPLEQGCDLPQERRVEVLTSETFGNTFPYPTLIRMVYDDACLHAGYAVSDPRGTA